MGRLIRYSQAEKMEIIRLVEGSELSVKQTLEGLGLPRSTFYNWDQMRSTGKFFAIGDDGAIANTPAGVFIHKLSVAQ